MGSEETEVPTKPTGRGGPRPGSGRKPGVKTGSHEDTAASYKLLAKAKAQNEMYKAKLSELEYKQKTGTLIEASRVGELWRKQVETAKGRLLSLPGLMAQGLVRKTSAAEIETELRDALLEIMEEIANAGLD